MIKTFFYLLAAGLLAVPALAQDIEVNRSTLGMFQPLPEAAENPKNPGSKAKIELGRKLYYDTRLSKDRTVSCQTCHDLSSFGDHGTPTSEGIGGQLGGRNAPTVYNAAIHISQFWDGREPDVERQAMGPPLAGPEMGMPSPEYVEKVLKSIPGYVELFKKSFPNDEQPVTFANMGNAIGAFERNLLTPSRFDQFLEGKEDALTNDEKKGLNTFISVGCTTCHNGAGVGGHLYQKVGLVEPWPGIKDKGRSEVTGNKAEEYFFKVPSLRNISETGPYFHDGSVADLAVMVKQMAKYQLGRELSQEDTESIVTFLKSLKGEIDEAYIKEPELPADGPNTPK